MTIEGKWAQSLHRGKKRTYHAHQAQDEDGVLWAMCNRETLRLDRDTSKTRDQVPPELVCQHCLRKVRRWRR